MTSFKKYVTYHFKTTFLRLVIIAVLSAVLVSTFILETRTIYASNGVRYSIQPGVLRIVAVTIATIIPVLEFLPFKNRRNMDTVLFLPIDRRKMAAVHFINGFLHILIINLICFAITFFTLRAYNYPCGLGNLSLLFAFTVFACLAVYAVTAFIFDRANITADGIIWLIFYSVLGIFIFDVGENIYCGIRKISFKELYATEPFFVPGILSPYFLLFNAWTTVQGILLPDYTIQETGATRTINLPSASASTITLIKSDITGMIFWAILIPLCIFGVIWMFKTKRPENIGAISDSAIGYKILLPLSAISIISVLQATLDDLGVYTVALVALVIGYIIYRRSIRFKAIDYASIAISLILPPILITFM